MYECQDSYGYCPSNTPLADDGRSLISTEAMAPAMPVFVATLVFSMWHGVSFRQAAVNPSDALLTFTRRATRILNTTNLPYSVLLLALKYLHRLKTRRPELHGVQGSETRLFVCTLMLAMKFLVDNTYSNKTWAKVSGIPIHEINTTEFEFMKEIDYNLAVSCKEYYSWIADIDQAINKFQYLTTQFPDLCCPVPSRIGMVSPRHFAPQAYPSPSPSPVDSIHSNQGSQASYAQNQYQVPLQIQNQIQYIQNQYSVQPPIQNHTQKHQSHRSHPKLRRACSFNDLQSRIDYY